MQIMEQTKGIVPSTLPSFALCSVSAPHQSHDDPVPCHVVDGWSKKAWPPIVWWCKDKKDKGWNIFVYIIIYLPISTPLISNCFVVFDTSTVLVLDTITIIGLATAFTRGIRCLSNKTPKSPRTHSARAAKNEYSPLWHCSHQSEKLRMSSREYIVK